MKIVDSTGVIDLVINFIIQFIMGKLLYYICVPVYRALPAGIQSGLRDLSDRGERWVQREKERRELWAQENDGLQQLDARAARESTSPPWEPADPPQERADTKPTRKLDLDGIQKKNESRKQEPADPPHERAHTKPLRKLDLDGIQKKNKPRKEEDDEL